MVLYFIVRIKGVSGTNISKSELFGDNVITIPVTQFYSGQ